MKSFIFVEFFEMVGSKTKWETTDELIVSEDVSSQETYTCLGTHDFNEMAGMNSACRAMTEIELSVFMCTFTRYLSASLETACSGVIQAFISPLVLFYSFERRIQEQVQRRFWDAEGLSFKIIEKKDTTSSMVYAFTQRWFRLAHIFIEKTFKYSKQTATIHHRLFKDAGTKVQLFLEQYGK